MNTSRRIVGLTAVAAVATVMCGCATTGYQKAEKTAVSMTDTRMEVQNAFRQVTLAINALDTLMKAQVGDLRPLYEDFASQVDGLRKAAGDARSRALTMQERDLAYFATWGQEIEAISDPGMKAQSVSRYRATKASHQAVEQSLFKTREAYLPLISTLNDLNTALAQDLTPKGLATLRPPHAKAREQAIALQKVMRESISAIDGAAQQLAPKAAGSM